MIYDTVFFNNQYTTGNLLVGNDLYVQGNFNLLPRGVICKGTNCAVFVKVQIVQYL
jgi:hypothetical protein